MYIEKYLYMTVQATSQLLKKKFNPSWAVSWEVQRFKFWVYCLEIKPKFVEGSQSHQNGKTIYTKIYFVVYQITLIEATTFAIQPATAWGWGSNS